MTEPTPLPARPNVDNVAHMLRSLAARIDSGEEAYEAVIVLGLLHVDAPPTVYQFGRDMGRLVEFGMLQAAQQTIGRKE